MDKTTAPTPDHPPVDIPQFAMAGTFLEALASQDFERLGTVLTADARLRALLPPGPREWVGADTIAKQFATWFADTRKFDLVDATVGEVGGRIHLRWRIRLQADRRGPGWRVIEQQAYADSSEHGYIAQLDLLCTGFRSETADG